MSKMPFGNSRVGVEFTPTVKLKDGDNVFRILPAMGDLADEGRWSFYHAIHYGYKNSEGKLRPFNSTYKVNRKTKMVEVEDAALQRINDLTKMLEQAKAAGDTVKVEKLNALVGRGPNTKAQFNLDKKHYMNALDAQGNVVILAISHKAKMSLDEEIKKQRAKGCDPLSAEDGRYFNFFRTGKGNETQVQVTVTQQEVEVPGYGKVKQDVKHTIDDGLVKRLLKQDKAGNWTFNEARNLSTLFPFPSADEITRIVKEGSKAVDEILDGGKANKQEAQPQADEEDDIPAYSAPVAPTVAPAAPVAPPVAPMAAAPIAPAAPVVTSAPAPFAVKQAAPTTAASISAQSDEDFLAGLGV